MAGKIFINYRRSLNLVEAQLLKKVLQRHFGERCVFLDVSGLEGGQHWLHTLEGQVDASTAMVSLIAKGWAGLKDESGARRLDNPDDFVRFEIARAFSRKIPVLPLRLNGADMPGVGDLPLNLVQLAFQQAMLLRSETFDDDADKIAARLKELIAPPSRRLPYWAAGAIAASALVAGLAGGPSVLTGLGLMQPSTDAGLRDALEQSQKRAANAETARKDAEAKYAVALGERDRAQTALKSAQEALATSQAKGEAAGAHVAELTEQLKSAELGLKEAQAALKAANGRADRAEAALKRPAPGPVAAEAAAPKAGESFKDCPDCPEMVEVPLNTFRMGSLDSEPEHQGNESPQHRVAIAKPFAVGRFAVTFAEWDACVDAGGCAHIPDDQGWGRGYRPVINVNWDDAKTYVKWLSKKTGKEYRLPTEAEREYVARAGTTTPFWWGSSITPEQANYDGSAEPYKGGGQKGEYRRKTMPVMSFKPNPWGLYQVHGNVWEWVEDCWHEGYSGAPADGTAWTAGDCSRRVLRGGSWSDFPLYLRAAYRGRYVPDYRYIIIGFRLARTLPLESLHP